MWQFLMANRHGLTVEQATVCLWLPELEYTKQKDVFDKAGRVEEVHCLSIGHYDSELGLCTTTQRYIPIEYIEKVKGLLLARVPEGAVMSSDLLTETEVGFAVHRKAADELVNPTLFSGRDSELQH